MRPRLTYVAVRPREVIIYVRYRHPVGLQKVVQLSVGVVLLWHLNASHCLLGIIIEKAKERLQITRIMTVTIVVVAPGLIEVRIVFQAPQVPEPLYRERQEEMRRTGVRQNTIYREGANT